MALTALVLLAGPCANWLQGRERWVFPSVARGMAGRQPDAVYMLAGERDQDRRVSALAAFVSEVGASNWRSVAILTGNELAVGPYSLADQTNLTVGGWAVRKLATLGLRAQRVPGRFNGTDGEMAALADYLREHPEIRTLAVCTSGFHVRRTLGRLAAHAGDGGPAIVVLCAYPSWRDRAPWTVLAELLKMARDAAGLNGARWVSRGPVRWPAESGV
jgi:hypothetical protein